ncbi:hypothetical protein CPC16_004021 [Podila verticillata]|nr:hypothetical protein CPC16_004021 [Podila verticillata]
MNAVPSSRSHSPPAPAPSDQFPSSTSSSARGLLVKSTLQCSDENYSDPNSLEELCFASRLVWSGFKGWEALSEALLLAKPHTTGDDPSLPRNPLQSLGLVGYSRGYPLTTFPALDAFTDVTSLSLKDCNTEFSAISSIFQVCPQLTHLSFNGNGLNSCSAGIDMDAANKLNPALNGPFPVPQLKALSITHPSLTVCQLLHLLETQSSLEVLELKDLSMRTFPPQDKTNHLANLQWLKDGILAYLRRYSASIQNLYVPVIDLDVYGIDTIRAWTEDIFGAELAQACPTVSTWRIMAPPWQVMGGSPGHFPVLRGLTHDLNVVTILDLQCEGTTLWRQHSSNLDNFLCHAHFLLHLRLPIMRGRPESMDVFHDRDIHMNCTKLETYLAQDASFTQTTRPRRRPVWACRSLKTLSIGFSGIEVIIPSARVPGRVDEYIPRSDRYRASHQARLFFGYLTRVCPDLEELVMVMNLTNLFLETGFCLLARLTKLRRLEIKLDWCSWPMAERIEIDWIKAENVAQEAGVGAQWKTRHWNHNNQSWEILHEWEAKIVAGRDNKCADDSQMEEVEEGDRWNYVGLFADVKIESLELQRSGRAGRHCWPMMESFRILDKENNPAEAEVIIKELRPEINCQSFKVDDPWGWEAFCL